MEALKIAAENFENAVFPNAMIVGDCVSSPAYMALRSIPCCSKHFTFAGDYALVAQT